MPGEHDESLRERLAKIDLLEDWWSFFRLIKDTEECEYYTINRQIKNSYMHFLACFTDCVFYVLLIFAKDKQITKPLTARTCSKSWPFKFY